MTLHLASALHLIFFRRCLCLSLRGTTVAGRWIPRVNLPRATSIPSDALRAEC